MKIIADRENRQAIYAEMILDREHVVDIDLERVAAVGDRRRLAVARTDGHDHAHPVSASHRSAGGVRRVNPISVGSIKRLPARIAYHQSVKPSAVR